MCKHNSTHILLERTHVPRKWCPKMAQNGINVSDFKIWSTWQYEDGSNLKWMIMKTWSGNSTSTRLLDHRKEDEVSFLALCLFFFFFSNASSLRMSPCRLWSRWSSGFVWNFFFITDIEMLGSLMSTLIKRYRWTKHNNRSVENLTLPSWIGSWCRIQRKFNVRECWSQLSTSITILNSPFAGEFHHFIVVSTWEPSSTVDARLPAMSSPTCTKVVIVVMMRMLVMAIT